MGNKSFLNESAWTFAVPVLGDEAKSTSGEESLLLSISMKAKRRTLFDGLREFLFVGLVPGVVSFTFVLKEPSGDLLPLPGSIVGT